MKFQKLIINYIEYEITLNQYIDLGRLTCLQYLVFESMYLGCISGYVFLLKDF